MRYAPVAVFAFRRPDHTARLLASLLANPEIRHSQVTAFCDGPRSSADRERIEATRAAVRAAGIPNLTLVERDRNRGLASSIIEGVTNLCAEHGRVIVLEDDLVVSPTFLGYMNAALDRYADASNVYGVSGFMYDVDLGTGKDAAFLPFISSWGWATWQRAWDAFDAGAAGYAQLRASRNLRRSFDLDGNYEFYDILEAQVRGRIDSWAIRWYLSVFLRGGLTLFPARSLVENHGFGGEGEHCRGDAPPHVRTVAAPFVVRRFPDPVLDPDALTRVEGFVGRDFTLAAKVKAASRAMLRRVGWE